MARDPDQIDIKAASFLERLKFVRDSKQNVAVRNVVDFDKSSTLIDIFGRLRVSEPTDLYTNKNVYNVDGINMKERTVGAATITYGGQDSSMHLNVTNADGDKATRQSRYLPYVPSKSQLITMTAVLAVNSRLNLYNEIGYFDDLNGIFFRETNGIFSVVVRSSVSGSPVDKEIIQSEFNIDTLDGNGPSGKTIDLSTTIIYKISFQWLGVGVVLFSVVLNDGVEIPFHMFEHSNINTDVYMSTPNLPIRYQIYNQGATDGNSTLKEICCSGVSEGAFALTGREYCIGNETVTRTATTTETPIFAVRLKNDYFGKENRVLNRLKKLKYYSASQATLFRVYKYFDPSSITATWTDVGNASACEFSTDITAITSVYNPSIAGEYVSADSNGANVIPSNSGESIDASNELSILCQNFDSTNSDVFVVTAQTFTSTSQVSTLMTWIENF